MPTLLHDPNNAASMAFLGMFGLAGEVITGHDACVAFMPNIQGFPCVVYEDAQGGKHALFNPSTMYEVEAWQAGIDNPPAPVKPTTMSKYTFLKRFTLAELTAAQAIVSTDVSLQVASKLLDAAQDVDLLDEHIQGYVGYLASKGLLTPERATAILTP